MKITLNITGSDDLILAARAAKKMVDRVAENRGVTAIEVEYETSEVYVCRHMPSGNYIVERVY